MTQYDFDLFVIGAGSGGVRAARMAAGQDKKVAVAEEAKAGGTCVNLGCIPKKIYVYAAEHQGLFQNAKPFGWKLPQPDFDWPTLRDNKSRVIAGGNKRIREMLEQSGARYIQGRARLISANEVVVADKTYSARRILIATGSEAEVQDIPGKEHLLTSDRIFDLEKLPGRILIVGGGYIAGEFAGIFHGLGVEVVQIYRGEMFLRGFDNDIRKFVADGMRRKGIDLRFNCDLSKLSVNSDGSYTATLTGGEILQTDLVLTAIGRRPKIADLGLEDVGVRLSENGAIEVDDTYQTSVPSIYALGDVIDRMQLTPVALAEAMTLVGNLYQDKSTVLDYRLVPTAVFTQPSIGTVGLTEEEALAQYPQVDVFSTEFKPLKNVLSGKEEQILMKLLVDRRTDRVLGAHMAGGEAAETIQGIAIALKAGASKADFDRTIGIHPTSAEEFVTMRSVTRRHG